MTERQKGRPITIRLTEEEFAQVELGARLCDTSLQGFVHPLIVEGTKRVLFEDEGIRNAAQEELLRIEKVRAELQKIVGQPPHQLPS